MTYLRGVIEEAGCRARRRFVRPLPPWPAVVLLAAWVVIEDFVGGRR